MRIVKFRIQHYKSIVDSGDCYPADQITIFAGKNEAGKSSILEALSDFNRASSIREKALPIEQGRRGNKPAIAITFEITNQFLLGVVDDLNIAPGLREQLASALTAESTVTITKGYPNTYDISGSIFTKIQDAKPSDWKVLLSDFLAIYSLMQTTSTFQKLGLPKLDLSTTSIDAGEKLSAYENRFEEISASLSESDKATASSSLKSLRFSLDQNATLKISLEEKLRDAILSALPTFILFSSFDDVFPNEIPLSDLSTNKWIIDLAAMSDLKVELITGSDKIARKQHKHELGVHINHDFVKFWTQDLSRISIDWDSEKLEFWIQEDDEFYPPEVRSQGRRWHLAFYIRVAARSREGVPNIILIDEPGLYLHAKAQRDILQHLESASGKCQIFISTHSPYLIESDKLERLRLVQKIKGRGTFIENKVHAVADMETLTPILTAIGLEVNQGIFATDKLNNVIVEGPSDYFYLTAMGELIQNTNLHFVSGGSSGNMPKIGTILQGWGAHIIYLYDNDQAFRDAQRSIKNDWLTISKEWLLTLNIDGAIEDIFTKDEYAAILGIDPQELEGKNSQFVKSKKRDKVLPARQFLGNVRSGKAEKLSVETLTTIKGLFALLAKKFESYQP